MKISVILCTYNRAESLRKTLESFASATVDRTIVWDLILIDNNSMDQTREVCDQYKEKIPIKYCFERAQGQSAARNRGIKEAQGALLAFTDDDVDIDPNWIKALCVGAEQHPEADFFGGPVFPQWEVPPPAWLARHSAGLLCGPAVHYERKAEGLELKAGEGFFVGANMMFRRNIFDAGFRFREDLGLKGSEAIRMEDNVFIKDLLTAGYRGIYIPDAIIFHRNPKERMTERYMLKWHIGCGRGFVRVETDRVKHPLVFGIPRYLWRELVTHSLRFIITRIFCSSTRWVPAECNMAITWGQILEFRQRSLVTR
jgi:glycosyltransferase involved in cell wall biosynthesis